jgi:hypothetical protein
MMLSFTCILSFVARLLFRLVRVYFSHPQDAPFTAPAVHNFRSYLRSCRYPLQMTTDLSS